MKNPIAAIFLFMAISAGTMAQGGSMIVNLFLNGSLTGPSVTICEGDTGILQVMATGGSGYYQYTWLTSGDPNVVYASGDSARITLNSPNYSGNISVMVTDVGSNTVNSSISYTILPQAEAGNAPISAVLVCQNALPAPLQSFMSPGNSGGQWYYDPFNTRQPTDAIYDPATDPPGYYMYVVSNGNCPADSAFFQIQQVAPPNVSVNSNITTTPGVNVPLFGQASGGTPPFTYQWSPSANMINANSINPTILNVTQTGLYTFTATDANGCSNSAQVLVTVQTAQVNAYAPKTQFQLCPGETDTVQVIASGGNSNNYTINWTPASAVSNPTSFSPFINVLTSTTITGVVSDGFATDTVVIQVNVAPPVNFVFQSLNDICVSYGVYNISAVSPPPSQGGYFTGPGVDSAGNVFPTIAGLGSHVITYTYVDPSGCVYTADQILTIVPPHQVGIDPITAVCANSGPISLTQGYTEPGLTGVYSGPGVINNTFYPSNSGAGDFTITYTVNDNGCINSASTILTVYDLPNTTLIGIPNFCQGDAPYLLSEGSPPGGTYSGNGVIGGLFYPDSTNGGLFSIITYTYTDSNGCTNSDDQSILIYPNPVITAFNPVSQVCLGDAPFPMSGGSPSSGGSYSGPGIVNGIFNPSSAGVGTHTVYYTITSTNGCVSMDSATITVLAEPVVALQLANNTLCNNGTAEILSGGFPAGGSYSGSGVSNGYFLPSQAGIGTHIITYTFNNANGCSATAIDTITVVVPTLSTMSAIGPFCINDGAIVLSGGSPAGGAYSGLGVNNNILYPGIAGSGTRLITYTYVDSNGCTSTSNTVYTIYNKPNTATYDLFPICENEAPLPLTNATPTGGTYYGPGVQNGFFDPAAVGPGTHTLFYTLANAVGCADTSSFSITVNAVDSIDFPDLPAQCLDGGSIALNSGWPAGGTYSGPGVSGAFFDPLIAGPGTHELEYVRTDAQGCTNRDTAYITIFPMPVASLSAIPDLCISDSAISLTQGLPAGGAYSGPGVSGTSFDPTTAGVGNHLIAYTYQDVNGCSDTAYTSIEVAAPTAINWNPNTTFCLEDAPYALNSATPAGGQFSGPGVIGNTFNPLNAGVGLHQISYQLPPNAGCPNDTLITLEVFQMPSLVVDTPPFICANDAPITLDFIQPSGGVYTSSSTLPGNTLDPATEGPGTVYLNYTYTNALGCTSEINTSLIIYPSPPVPQIIQSGDYLYCNWGFYDYQWYLNGQAIDTAQQQTIYTQGSGNYTVEIINDYGCSSVSQPFFAHGVGVDETEINSLQLYPNPASHTIYLHWDEPLAGYLLLRDLQGRTLERHPLSESAREFQLDVQHIRQGAYILQLESVSKKAIKQLLIYR